jgi:Ca2+-binding RTX toxin-like protein
VAQSLAFTTSDQLAFDAGGSGAQIGVSIGPTVTTLTFGSKSAVFQNGALNADQDGAGNPELLTLDGSRLFIDAAGVAANVVGSALNDQFQGSSDTSAAADTFTGLAGDDIIRGGAGADSISGGEVAGLGTATSAGNDSIDGNLGNDVINGAGGNDSLVGGFGDDVIFGGGGNDSIAGNVGNDAVDAGSGNDSVFGGQNNDTLLGNTGDDSGIVAQTPRRELSRERAMSYVGAGTGPPRWQRFH